MNREWITMRHMFGCVAKCKFRPSSYLRVRWALMLYSLAAVILTGTALRADGVV